MSRLRWGPADGLAAHRHRHRGRAPAELSAEPGLVVEETEGGFCGAVIACEKAPGGHVVILEDRHGRRRAFPLGPGFAQDGRPVNLVRPTAAEAPPARTRSASGSVAVRLDRARVARGSRIYVEGRHDAELVEKVWGHDLRVAGVVVEPMDGVDDLAGLVAEFRPGPDRRLGVLVDHLVEGSKEARLAAAVRCPHVLVVGHPFIDIWAAVKPSVVGIPCWPRVPRGRPWKEGVIQALGWDLPAHLAWRRILDAVGTYADLEPELLGRVEELIDFVTAEIPEAT